MSSHTTSTTTTTLPPSFHDSTRGKYHPARYTPAPVLHADSAADDTLLETSTQNLTQWASRHKKHILLFGLPAAAYTLLIGALLAVLFKPVSECSLDAGAQSALSVHQHWELQKLQPLSEDPFSGIPRAELENSWNSVLGPSQFTLSDSTIASVDRLDDEDISLPDPETGLLTHLNVFHELKCIKWLHASLYTEHYFPNMTQGRKEQVRLQSEYCLRHLRRAAMCHADMPGGVQYEWKVDGEEGPRVDTEYQCGVPGSQYGDGNGSDAPNGGAPQFAADKGPFGFRPGYIIQPAFALLLLFKGTSIRRRAAAIMSVTARWGGEALSDTTQALRQKME